ncbi:hypothetical protein UCRNP2_8580 [Neofusicoccum parvum UCRNP2]|uniref:Uncharacterized protein n=1 Tax=Botryosphaeria parva (strain UCR-NP2) TaxID=1287680 RepID=R1FZX2_BOTPV|nr:hypothetical protein UCRNP2_8580 [Neofusicoccum parvum UCRNP2]
MQFSYALFGFLLASFGTALPADISNGVNTVAEPELFARADMVAVNRALLSIHIHSDFLEEKYPKNYGGNDSGVKFPDDCKIGKNGGVRKYVEYPLGKDNTFDRVVLGWTGNSFKYCGAITHRGLDDNQFKSCTNA